MISKRATKQSFKLFATTGKGLEEALAGELRRIGASSVEPAQRGVSFRGDLALIYRANLWLRTAHRVLFEIANFEASDRSNLYEGARSIRWSDHMAPNGRLAVDAVCNRSELTHTRFISQVIKDAIVDQFRETAGNRPAVDLESPDLKVNARILENRCTLSIDTSGERLNRRGYRPVFGVEAPLAETLAAGVVMLSGFDGSAPFVDPMCGSGTLLVEAALIARNVAPGLLGRNFGLMRHPSFEKRIWNDAMEEAKEAVKRDQEVEIVGADVSENALRAARASAKGAGVDDVVKLRRAGLDDLKGRDKGMVVTNPPYGERLGEIEKLADLYRTLGDVLKQRCRGMTAHILTGSKFLAGKIGLRPGQRHLLWNGPIECRLLHFDLY